MQVTGFLLKMNLEDEDRFYSALGDFRQQPENLRSQIEPHLTLTLSPIPPVNKQNLIAVLKEKLQGHVAININFGNAQLLNGSQWLALPVNSQQVYDLHLDVIDIVKDFNDGLYMTKYLQQNINEREREYLLRYGYIRVKEFFQPHVTIGHYDNLEIAQHYLSLAPKLDGSFSFNRLVVEDLDAETWETEEVVMEVELK